MVEMKQLSVGGNVYEIVDAAARSAASTNAANIANAQATLDAIVASGANDVSVELLWTNATPSSSCGEVDLEIDLSGYDMFAVWTVHSTTTGTITPIAIGPVGKSVAAQLIYGSNGRVGSRKFTDNGTTITVGPGQYNGGSDNKYLIPYQIYGIKGVKIL